MITYDISQPCNKTGTATFNAEVLDGQGRPLSNASVTFLIAGKVLTNYCYDIYKINVNPIGEPIDDINRMRGQLLGRDYVVPEAIKNNYSLVVDVHSNQGGAYVITNFVFAPAQDNVSKVIATKIINDNPGLQEYFPASQTSPAYVTLPIQRSGTPTILYETYKYEDYNNVTVPYVDLLIESVDTIFDYIS